MLLPGRQRQDIAATSLGINRLARQAPWHLPDKLIPGGKKAQVRPAIAEGITERLPLADDDIGAPGPGRLEQAKGYRLGDDFDQQRLVVMEYLGKAGQILDHPEKVGALHDHAGHPWRQ